MTIRVEQKYIDNGRRRQCTGCALTLALREQWDETAIVGTDMFWRSGSSENYYLPKIAIEFRERFDSHEPVQPFTFEIELA